MKNDLIDLYSDYLLSSFDKTTATGAAELLDALFPRSGDRLSHKLKIQGKIRGVYIHSASLGRYELSVGFKGVWWS